MNARKLAFNVNTLYCLCRLTYEGMVKLEDYLKKLTKGDL